MNALPDKMSVEFRRANQAATDLYTDKPVVARTLLSAARQGEERRKKVRVAWLSKGATHDAITSGMCGQPRLRS